MAGQIAKSIENLQNCQPCSTESRLGEGRVDTPMKKAARVGGFVVVQSQAGYALLRCLNQPAPRKLKPISDQTMQEAGSGV